MASEREEPAGRPGFRPVHPGRILKKTILPALGPVAIVQLAAHLRITRQSLYKLLDEKRSVTPDMAVRLAGAFGNSPMFWLNLQAAHDVWEAEKKAENRVARLTAA